METGEQLVDAWRIHARITLFLLEAVEPEALEDQLSTRGWTVGKQFAHIHDVRLMWLAGYPDLQSGLEKVPKEQMTDKARLAEALAASAERVAQMIERGVAAGKVKGFKPHAAAFVGYIIAHESYHHGEIGLILGQSGHRLPSEVAFGMWEWGKR